jgi:ferredoxin--NADP+ reductase
MYRIIEKEDLSDLVKLFVVEVPHISHSARAGQFVIVLNHEHGERIPLTIADHDPVNGTITLVVQEVGKSTMELCRRQAGDTLFAVAGPLGQPSEIEDYGTVVCVAGGVGIAPIYPIARALKEVGNTVITIAGARTQDLLFWEERLRSVSHELIVCTDDGSYGRKALVTEPLAEVLESRKGEVSRIWTVGPAIMMKFVCRTTKPFNVPTIVSLNAIMCDGTGMCGGCRVRTDEGAIFACVNGPEVDGHKLDWDNFMSRLQYYRNEEKLALEHWQLAAAGSR